MLFIDVRGELEEAAEDESEGNLISESLVE